MKSHSKKSRAKKSRINKSYITKSKKSKSHPKKSKRPKNESSAERAMRKYLESLNNEESPYVSPYEKPDKEMIRAPDIKLLNKGRTRNAFKNVRYNNDTGMMYKCKNMFPDINRSKSRKRYRELIFDKGIYTHTEDKKLEKLLRKYLRSPK